MVKKFYNYILAGYAGDSIEIRKKAKLLLTSILIFISANIPGIFQLLFVNSVFSASQNNIILALVIMSLFLYIAVIIFLKKNRYNIASLLALGIVAAVLTVVLMMIKMVSIYQLAYNAFIFLVLLLASFLFAYKLLYVIISALYSVFILMFILFMNLGFDTVFGKIENSSVFILVMLFYFIITALVIINFRNMKDIVKIAMQESDDNGKIAMESKRIAEQAEKVNSTLKLVMEKLKKIIACLNTASKEIETAAQEQTSAASEYASGISEVSVTLQELKITAKQITTNVGELVFSSEEMIKLLHENEKQLLSTVSQLEDAGNISRNNTSKIGELGKRSIIINEMVELIKEIATRTNILSINASIEASRSGEAGTRFSVVAAEIRDLSKETIESAKKTEKAAQEIRNFLNSIIMSSGKESGKVVESGKTVKMISDNMKDLAAKIANNYSFTQKIDVSIKQQESGSVQAAETIRQMAELARQSAETSKQILEAGKNIVEYSSELENTSREVE